MYPFEYSKHLLCKEEGCKGTKTEKTCCCRGDLCNYSRGSTFITALIASTLFALKIT
uniref:UPAR/Ly6 domain-containing protein n=1 Tax=Haemonchus contortus TaxID=6289 RepID=A0A7I4Z6N3_HAECO